ncbi:sensor histidine kinase [Smaragdicoccus niigatensis]|uniref:sensor histidine kinase n=1 Tax=Smaragdicoccus niigatensis TaxID=359359 RepID=UPI00037AD0A5|nr:sensor histidine kinase [Smaragdicoccus niigatensis]
MTDMSDLIDRKRRKRSRLSVQGWLYVVLGIMGAVVLVGMVAGIALLQQSNDRSNALVLTVQPARIAALQLQSALIDQETATRGYAITADPQFLEPYETGRKTEDTHVRELEQLLVDDPGLVKSVIEVERAADTWRADYVDPVLANVVPGSPKLIDAQLAMAGKSAFDTVRAKMDQLNAQISDVRAVRIGELTQTRHLRDSVLAATVGVFFATSILLAVLVRVAVTRPLANLAAACRRTTEGNFDESIDPQGPRDIFDIGVAVEAMRGRLVAALQLSQEQHRTVERQARFLDAQSVELRRSNAELEQFAFTASHDLQEPLRKVASFCQLLQKRYADKLDERGIQYIDFAVDGARRMQTLINDLLSFSRVGRQSVTSEDVALDATVDDAMRNLSTAIRENDATIVCSHRPLPHVTGDPTLLTMLWQNLIANGMKFHRPGTAPTIVIDWHAGEGPDDSLVLMVSDNGIGIAEEFSDKVFIIFQRLHSREAYPGTGIGLAMCKKIVEHHGGRIWIDNEHTDGTRFCFTLPGASYTSLEMMKGIAP